MGGAGVYDWVYLIAGVGIALTGLALGAWALFWDRSRGRKRCPKCWYDMGGAVATLNDEREEFICPECGAPVRSAKGLLRTRRRVRWAMISAVLLCLAYVAAKVPAATRRGWTELVPGWALAIFAPADESLVRSFRGGLLQVWLTGGPKTGAPAGTSIREDLAKAALQRMDDGRMARWQSQAFIGRYFASLSGGIATHVDLPDRWLVGQPIPICFKGSPFGSVVVHGNGTFWSNAFGDRNTCVEFAGSAPFRVPIEIRLRGRTLYAGALECPVIPVTDAADLVERIDSPAAGQQVRDALEIHVVRAWETLEILVKDRSEDTRWQSIDYPLTYRVDLLSAGRIVGTAHGAASAKALPWNSWRQLAVTWVPGGAAALIAALESGRVIVTGEPAQLLRRYAQWPFHGPPPRAWTGSFELPLAIVESSDAGGPERMPDVFRRLEIEGY